MTDLETSSPNDGPTPSPSTDATPHQPDRPKWVRLAVWFVVVPTTIFALLVVWHFNFVALLQTGAFSASLLGVAALAVTVCVALCHAAGLIRPARAVRWWLALLIVTGGVLLHFAISRATSLPHLEKYLHDLNATFAGWLLLLWLFCLSGMRFKTRVAVFGGFVAFIASLAVCFRFIGLAGDGYPRFVWRFRAEEPIEKKVASSGARADILQADLTTAGLNDYPGFLGPNRDATLPSMPLSRDWKSTPPRLIWRRPVGAGWGAFAIAGNLAVTQEQHGPQEAVVCHQLQTGKEIWRHQDAACFASAATGDGPRATPTVYQGTVYTFGATGILNCLDAATGTSIWTVDTLKDNGAPPLIHGMSGSPLVVGDVVVVCAGGTSGRSLVAYDRHTGQRAFSAGDAKAAYTSPQLARVDGQWQILMHNADGLFAHDPADGRILWYFDWKNDAGTNCTQPVAFDDGTDRILAVTGEGEGCAMIHVSRHATGGWTTVRLWHSRGLHSKFANVVARDNYAYGLDNGILVCLDLKDGRRCWKRGRYGHGQLLLVGDLLLVQAEKGDVVLVEATPEEHRELTRFAALSSKTWNHPALSGRLLVVRNDREAACYELPLEPASEE